MTNKDLWLKPSEHYATLKILVLKSRDQSKNPMRFPLTAANWVSDISGLKGVHKANNNMPYCVNLVYSGTD